MALQSAISSAPLEKFSTDEEVMEEDGFTLRLSDGEDEDVVSMWQSFFLIVLFSFKSVVCFVCRK